MGKDFMFNSRNSDAQRKARQEKEIDLRRMKAEEMLKRKRTDLGETIEMTNTSSFIKNVNNIMSNDLNKVYKGVYEFRTILSVSHNPPIQGVIDAEIIPRIVTLLSKNFYPQYDTLAENIRLEAGWVLTNICTGTHEQTKIVIDAGAIQPLSEMVGDEESKGIFDQALWCIGNIAGDCEEFRDLLLERGVLEALIGKVDIYANNADEVKILSNCIWCLSNLNRGRNPPPSYESMFKSFGVFENIVNSSNYGIVSDCFWGLSYICDVSPKLVDSVLESPIISRIKDLLNAYTYGYEHKQKNLLGKIAKHSLVPIIHTIGSIVSNTDNQTDIIIKSGVFSYLPFIFNTITGGNAMRIRKDICWAISNVAAGTIEQTEYVITDPFITVIINAINMYELLVKKEAIYALSSISSHLKNDVKLLEKIPLLDLFRALGMYISAISNEPEAQYLVLKTVHEFLDAGRTVMRHIGKNPVNDILSDNEHILLIHIKDISQSNYPKPANKANAILEEYFTLESNIF